VVSIFSSGVTAEYLKKKFLFSVFLFNRSEKFNELKSEVAFILVNSKIVTWKLRQCFLCAIFFVVFTTIFVFFFFQVKVPVVFFKFRLMDF
jgi:hypothetical protein